MAFYCGQALYLIKLRNEYIYGGLSEKAKRMKKTRKVCDLESHMIRSDDVYHKDLQACVG